MDGNRNTQYFREFRILLSAFLERQPYPYDDVLKDKVTAAIIVGSIGETVAALILTSRLSPSKYLVGWD
jgi:hypothetical protein